MKYEIVEISKDGTETVWMTKTVDEFFTKEKLENVTKNRDRIFKDFGYRYYYRAA